MFLSTSFCMHHVYTSYANENLEPPPVKESGHNVYFSKIQRLMRRASILMKAIGLCEWRLLFQSFIL